MLAAEGLIEPLLDAGGRMLECTCGPCIGIGGSPVSGGVTARTFNRNFEGRSGTQDAKAYLVSPQTAAQAALNGAFTDPATWGAPPAKVLMPKKVPSITHLFVYPPEDSAAVEVLRGPNIVALSRFDKAPEAIDALVALKVGDDITTDHILPGGSVVMSLRSNIPAISEHVFINVDKGFVSRIKELGGGVIVGGENYGQGSSREHAALAPKYLGVQAVIVKSLARIHRANLVNFGILPLLLENAADYDALTQGGRIVIPVAKIKPGKPVAARVDNATTVMLTNDLTRKELDIILAGGLLNAVGNS
jgi:aconitate hydratase